MSARVFRGRDVRLTINGVEVVGFETFEFRDRPPDPLPLRWAGWFDRVWEGAGRRRDPEVVGLPLAAVRLGHRELAEGRWPFPRPMES